MATLPAQLTQYNAQFHSGFLERLADVSDAFNAQSNGAIVLRSESLIGNVAQQSLYTGAGSVVHRDITSNTPVSDQLLQDTEAVSVKTAWRFGPLATTDEALLRKGQSLDTFRFLAGNRSAEAALQYQLDCAIASMTGAFLGNSGVQASGNLATEGRKVLTKGLRRFGDRFSDLRLWVMSSASYFDIVDSAIVDKLFGEIGAVIYGGLPGTLGLPVLVTDRCPDSLIFGLRDGGVELVQSQPPVYAEDRVTGLPNLAYRIQAEGVFNAAVFGYRWAPSPAIVNPNASQLAGSTAWTKWATDDKNTAGIVIQLTT